jgi:opacity protein-like surface antigen
MAFRIAALAVAVVLLWSPSASARNEQKAAYLAGVCLIALVGTPIAANADPEGDYDRNGFYVGGGATLGLDVFMQDEYRDALEDAGGRNVDAHVEHSFGANAHLGYRFHPRFSGEVEFEWLDSFDLSAKGAGFSDVREIETWVATGNAKGYLLTGSIQPFALVGVGAMKIKPDLGSDETELALRLGVGLDLYFSQRFVVDLGVDYVYPTGDLKKDFAHVSVAVALQYRF